jgi:NADH-quinone oxidoreductase subunit E
MIAENKRGAELLSDKVRAGIDEWVAKYPPDQKQSAVMAALRLVQEERGWLSTELMDAVADYLEMEPITVYEVATFYSMYDLKPVGRHKISVCTNISCMLCGASEIMTYLEKKLDVKRGGTTADGRFVLKEVECLAACAGAPMFQIDKTYYEHLTPDKIDAILAEYE